LPRARLSFVGAVVSTTPLHPSDAAPYTPHDTIYGLTNFVQTADGARRNRVARRLRAGMIEMNRESRGAGSAFGGIKASGRAREGGVMGLEEFMDSKHISAWDIGA
ncbi:MAG: aldehyde dehydrogenase family protein, partial [Mesorhizobium sp.]